MDNWLLDSFEKFHSKVAIIHNDNRYTYERLYNKIQEYLELFKDNIQQDEIVAILGDYSFENIALLLALYQNKNTMVPITSTKKNEVDDRLSESNCDKTIQMNNNKIIIQSLFNKEKHQLIKNLQNKKKSGLILFSSGSTGKPKAMVHNFDNLIEHYEGKKEKNMNMLLFLMFDHIGGLNTLLNILTIGATAVIPNNRNADEVCKVIQDYKIRILPSSPTFLNLILMSQSYKKYTLSSLRMISYGTETMPEPLLNRLKAIFPKVKFLQTFGTSETGIANTLSKSSNSTFMKIDDPNLEYKIINDELCLKSKIQIIGYLNASMDSFTDDGWFKTGDLVETTDDGYIKIIGRNKEVINVGGEKVLPVEVESIILQIPNVIDSMVYGETNAIMGQIVVVDVVMNEGIDKREAKKIIRKYCKDKLDNYKIPTKINLVEKTNFGDRFKKIRLKN